MKAFRKSPNLLFFSIWIFLIMTGYLAAVGYLVIEIPDVLVGFISINIATFFLYGLDKLLAIARTRRVPERTLQLTAFLFGSPGALLAMNVFRHKTQKTSFQLVLAFLVLFQIMIAAAILYFIEPDFFIRG